MNTDIAFISKNTNVLRNKNVLLRASLNTPVKDGVVLSNFRIKKAAESINKVLKYNPVLTIIAHQGRNKSETLKPIFNELKKYVLTLRFAKNVYEYLELRKKTKAPILLENIRQNEKENENDASYAKQLASLGEVFVQDAFSVCHREHTSMVKIPEFLPSYAGFLFEDEITYLEKIKDPEKPALFVLGGSKFKTKEDLIKKALLEFSEILIVGALANDFLSQKGYSVGASLVSGKKIPRNILFNKKIKLPSEYVVLSKKGSRKINIIKDKILDDEIILDSFAPDKVKNKIKNAYYNTIVWNGPFGFYEKGYTKGSYEFLNILKKAKSYKVAGGGDTVSILSFFNCFDCFDFVSTAGGAMIDFIVHEYDIPCIKALKNSADKFNLI